MTNYYELGWAAFNAGCPAVPGADPAMRHVVGSDGPVGSAIPALRAWTHGWHAANLAQR